MATILIGWELGANRGHSGPIAAVGNALAARGHRIVYAVQQIDALTDLVPCDAIVVQAPVWPRLLKSIPQPGGNTTATYADILVQLGLTEPGTLTAMIATWDRLLVMCGADGVIADFAPALGMAARGRLPVVAVGSSFCQPPSAMPVFPNFFGTLAQGDQPTILARVNTDLAAAGRLPLSRLPDMVAADAEIVTGFAELDAYHDWRSLPLASPLGDEFHSIAADGNGDEIFVYYFQSSGPVTKLWDALAQTRLPVRVHMPRIDSVTATTLNQYGFIVEAASVPWRDIAARSRMAISHGGMGFVSSALAAGLPQLVTYFDVEKLLTGRAVSRLGLGAHVHALHFDRERGAAAIQRLYNSDEIAQRARGARPDFIAQLGNDPIKLTLTAIERLLS